MYIHHAWVLLHVIVHVLSFSIVVQEDLGTKFHRPVSTFADTDGPKRFGINTFKDSDGPVTTDC